MTDIQKENKSGGKVPNLRFPEFEGEWEVKKLGDLLEFKNGINASKEQYGKGVKFINVLDILNNDFITYESIIGKVDVDSTIIEKFSVQYGDVLFQRSSETREEVGTANIYLDKDKIATFGGFVIRGKKIGNYNPIFFNKLLKTESARESITSKSGGSTRFNIGQDILSSISLYFPSIYEQDRIASFFSLIDERIQTQNKIIKELKTLKASTAKKIFSQELRFKDDNNTYPVYSSQTKNNGLAGYYTDFLFEDAITWTTDGANAGDVNYRSGKFYCTNVCGVLISNEGYANSCIAELINSVSKNYVSYVGNPKLMNGVMSEIKIPFPSLPEQTKIANFLSSIDSKIDIENQLLQKLEEQKKFLLQNMFV